MKNTLPWMTPWKCQSISCVWYPEDRKRPTQEDWNTCLFVCWSNPSRTLFSIGLSAWIYRCIYMYISKCIIYVCICVSRLRKGEKKNKTKTKTKTKKGEREVIQKILLSLLMMCAMLNVGPALDWSWCHGRVLKRFSRARSQPLVFSLLSRTPINAAWEVSENLIGFISWPINGIINHSL